MLKTGQRSSGAPVLWSLPVFSWGSVCAGSLASMPVGTSVTSCPRHPAVVDCGLLRRLLCMQAALNTHRLSLFPKICQSVSQRPRTRLSQCPPHTWAIFLGSGLGTVWWAPFRPHIDRLPVEPSESRQASQGAAVLWGELVRTLDPFCFLTWLLGLCDCCSKLIRY